MSKRRNSGYMLQPRSAEITRQRAATVDVLFPAVQQPSLYTRVKTRISSLWTHFFSPAEEQRVLDGSMSAEQPKRHSPQKRQSEIDQAVDVKRFKPNPPANRYSCASLSQEESVEEPLRAPAKRDPPHFTPVLTRSNLRGFSRPLREETKITSEVCPANPRLQRSPPKQRLSDQALEAAVIREAFEKEANRMIDKVLAEGERLGEKESRQTEEKQVQKSKTPTPRRDEILHAKSTPRSQIMLVVQEPCLQDQRRLSDPKAAKDSVPELPTVSEFAKKTDPPVVTEFKPTDKKPDPPSIHADPVKPTAGLLPAESAKPTTVSFVLPPEQFKPVLPESPGFASSSSLSEKSSEEQQAKQDEVETSELSPIKDLCDRPEETKPVPPVVVQVADPKPLFPGLQVNTNPFTEPPPADNPFLKPMTSERPATFVFGQAASYHPPAVAPAPQSAFPNPFLSAPSTVLATPWPPQPSGTAMEDAEMKAETPKAVNFPSFPGQHAAYPPPPPAVQQFPQPTAPISNFTQSYQPFGAFQTSLGQNTQPAPSNPGGNFSIGNVGSRRIYRAKRPGQ